MLLDLNTNTNTVLKLEAGSGCRLSAVIPQVRFEFAASHVHCKESGIRDRDVKTEISSN